MRRRKWWSNREREAGHEWVSEGLAADAGRRKGPVLVSISPTWLLLPPPPLRIRRLLQAKGKISADLSGLKSLALPWAGRHSGRVCGSPDPGLGARVGSWRGRWDVWCSWATALSENWDPLLCWMSWCHGAVEKKLEEGRMNMSMGSETPWA